MYSLPYGDWNIQHFTFVYVIFCVFSHDALQPNLFRCLHSLFVHLVISQLLHDVVHLSRTTSCASQLCDYAEASSELNVMQAACGRWLCETQTVMKADKHHKPVGSRKHWAGNHKLHSSLHCFLLRHPPWRPRSSSLCWLQKAQGSLRRDLRGIARRKHN